MKVSAAAATACSRKFSESQPQEPHGVYPSWRETLLISSLSKKTRTLSENVISRASPQAGFKKCFARIPALLIYRMPSALQSSSSAAVSRGDSNRLEANDRAAHDWYRFVLSFPPHLVREYVNRFELDANACVLDPFCGTGTTIVECKKIGIASVGVEAHPMSHFASAPRLISRTRIS